MAATRKTRTLREALALCNKSKVARAIGVEPSTIGRWETGEMIPSADKFQDLCRVLEIDPMTIEFGEAA